jgi:coenzyme Q-binding protein COQ10
MEGALTRIAHRSGNIERTTDVSSQKRERLLPYTAEQLFDLAADVERYPEYLPWWIAARIRKREANVYYTHQVLGLGPIRVSFGSKTVLQPPTRIDVTSKESPFQQFQLSWNFAALAGTGCRVSLTAEFELRSLILQRILDRVLPTATADIIAAFETRAHSLYERAGSPAKAPRD